MTWRIGYLPFEGIGRLALAASRQGGCYRLRHHGISPPEFPHRSLMAIFCPSLLNCFDLALMIIDIAGDICDAHLTHYFSRADSVITYAPLLSGHYFFFGRRRRQYRCCCYYMLHKLPHCHDRRPPPHFKSRSPAYHAAMSLIR